MTKGLHVWEDSGRCVILDPDNVFWAVTPSTHGKSAFIPQDALNLYGRVKEKLSSEMNDFRFSKELTAIYINPTERCNANCTYCYVPHKARTKGHSMTGAELDFILNKLAGHFKNTKRKQVIIFHASEPLIVKDIVFAAIYKYRDIFKFGIQTNATLLNKKDVNFLKDRLVGVGISIDSHIPLINDRQRPMSRSGGSFAHAVNTLKWFDGYQGLNVISTVTKYNVKDLPGMVKFLHAYKVPCVLFNPVRFTRVSPKALKPDEKLFVKYFIEAVETAMALSGTSDHKIIIGNFANTVLAIVAPEARRLMCDISPCGGGRCFFTITATGEMIPCGEFVGLPNFSGGNIFKEGVAEAMGSRPFKAVRARMVEKIKECDRCELRNICGAPCPAELHSRGDMYQKAIFCDFYKEIIKYAFKIISEDKVKYVLRDEPLKKLAYKYRLAHK